MLCAFASSPVFVMYSAGRIERDADSCSQPKSPPVTQINHVCASVCVSACSVRVSMCVPIQILHHHRRLPTATIVINNLNRATQTEPTSIHKTITTNMPTHPQQTPWTLLIVQDSRVSLPTISCGRLLRSPHLVIRIRKSPYRISATSKSGDNGSAGLKPRKDNSTELDSVVEMRVHAFTNDVHCW